jgi:hypothetical protein
MALALADKTNADIVWDWSRLRPSRYCRSHNEAKWL